MSFRREICVYTVIYLLLVVIMPHHQFEKDASAWVAWSTYLLNHGIGTIYSLDGANYAPAYYYILWVYAHLQGTQQLITSHIYMLRYFTLLIEFAGIIFISHFLSGKTQRLGSVLLCICNAGFLYNTMIWGQCDGLVGALLLVSILLLWNGRLISSVVLLTLAFYTKFIVIVFIPVWLLLLLACWRRYNLRQLILAVAGSVMLQGLLLSPYICAGTLTGVINTTREYVGYCPVVAKCAYNIWSLLLTGETNQIPDNSLFLTITYRTWGIIMFGLNMAAILIPLFLVALRGLKNEAESIPVPVFLIAGGLVGLSFFYFNTEMHERYSQHCLWFFAAYALYSQRYLLFLLTSIALFLSLEGIMQAIGLNNYKTFIFQSTTISCIYGISLITGYYIYQKEIKLAWQEG